MAARQAVRSSPVAVGRLEDLGEAVLERRSEIGVAHDPEAVVLDRVHDHARDLGRFLAAGTGEAAADRLAPRLGVGGAFLVPEVAGAVALALHHVRVRRARAQHAHADRSTGEASSVRSVSDSDTTPTFATAYGAEVARRRSRGPRSTRCSRCGRAFPVEHDREEGVHAVDHAPQVDAEHPLPVGDGQAARWC